MSDYDSDRTETAVEEGGPDEDFLSDLLTQQLDPMIYDSTDDEEEEEESKNNDEKDLKDTDHNHTLWFPTSSSNGIFESTGSSDVTTTNQNLSKESGNKKNEPSIWKPALSDEIHVFTANSIINSNEVKNINETNQSDSCIFELEEGNLFYTGETRSLPRTDSHPVSESIEKATSVQQSSTHEIHEKTHDQSLQEPKCDLERMFDSEKDTMSIGSSSNRARASEQPQPQLHDEKQLGDNLEQTKAILSNKSERSENTGSTHHSSDKTLVIELESHHSSDKTLVIELESSPSKNTYASHESSKSNQDLHKKQNDDEEKSENHSAIILNTSEKSNNLETPVVQIDDKKGNKTSHSQKLILEPDANNQDAPIEAFAGKMMNEENQKNKLVGTSDKIEGNDMESSMHNKSWNEMNSKKLYLNHRDKVTPLAEQEQELSNDPPQLIYVNSSKQKQTGILGGEQDLNLQRRGVNDHDNSKAESTNKELTSSFIKGNADTEKINKSENANNEDDNVSVGKKSAAKHVTNGNATEELKADDKILEETETIKTRNLNDSLFSKEDDAICENRNTVDEIEDQDEENNHSADRANHNRVMFSETPTIICTLSPIEEPNHRSDDRNNLKALENTVQNAERETSEIHTTLEEDCNDKSEKQDVSIDEKTSHELSTGDAFFLPEKKVDFILEANIYNSETPKENVDFSNSVDTNKSSPILLRRESVPLHDNDCFKTKATADTKLKSNELLNTNYAGKSNRKASAWITPNKKFFQENDFSRLVLPGKPGQEDDDVASEENEFTDSHEEHDFTDKHEEHEFAHSHEDHEEHEFTDNDKKRDLQSPDVNGIDFSKPAISQGSTLQNTQEGDDSPRVRSRNILNRLRRGISTQDTSYSRNNENADKHQNEMHEAHGSIKSNNDANIDDALMSLISKYEEKLTEYEGKICILENKLAESQATIKETDYEKKIRTLKYELAQSQATIKEKDKDIDSLKHNHRHIENCIVNAERKLNKRKLSLPPDEPSARCKADEKENAVVDESLSNEEISDNDSLASSDTSEEDNVYETVSFSSSEREIVFSSDDEDVQMEDWDDYALMEQSNNRLTFKSYKSIVRISKDFLSESQTCSYKRLLWNPIWNVLKSQGESTTMRWKYGKNPSNLDLGPNWIFVPPKSGRKKVKGVDYFEKEDDVLREIFYCIRLINVRSISDGELSELGNLCALDFHSSRKMRKVESAEVSPRRSSTSRKDNSKTKIKTHDRERKSKSSSDLEKPQRNQKLDNASSAKRKRPSSTSSTSKEKSSAHKKPKIRQRAQRARKSKPFKKDIELSKSQCNNKDVKNTNEHSQSTLAGADILLALTHADANNHKCVADEQNHIQPSNEFKVHDELSIGDFTKILDSKDVATASGIKKLSNMRNEARIATQKSVKDKQTLVKSNSAQIITPMKSPTINKHERMPPHFSQSPDSPPTYATSSSANNDSKMSLLENYSFFVSGVEESIVQSIINLGGAVVSDMQKLGKLGYSKKLFFLSAPSCRKKFKYILAASLGVPMLHFSWITEQERRCNAKKGNLSIFDGRLYSQSRLPTGLSFNSGVYKLQRASDAKHWKQPIDSTGKPIFDGMTFSVICERKESEKEWELILSTLGASIKDKRDRSEEDLSRVLDAIIIDSLDVPPHSKAPPARLSSFLKRVDKSNSSIPLIDFSWVVQCITNRKRLAFDSDPRFLVDIFSRDSALYSIKINAVRYDIGDYVQIKTKTERSFARIDGIKPNTNQRHGYRLDVRCLVQEGANQLVDAGKYGSNLTVDESNIESHVLIVSSSDYELIKDGYGKESCVFTLKIKC